MIMNRKITIKNKKIRSFIRAKKTFIDVFMQTDFADDKVILNCRWAHLLFRWSSCKYSYFMADYLMRVA